MTVWRRVYGYGSFRDCASAHSRARFDVESVEVDESVVVVESVSRGGGGGRVGCRRRIGSGRRVSAH